MRILSAILVLSTVAASGTPAADVGSLEFAVQNRRDAAIEEVVRVSLPVPAGLLVAKTPQQVASGADRWPVQTHVVTRHPDGSVRRMMVSFPVRLGAKSSGQFACVAGGEAAAPLPMASIEGNRATIRTDAFDLHFSDDAWEFRDHRGQPLAKIRATSPAQAVPAAATLTVVENGPYFVWLRWSRDARDYRRDVDLQADKYGRLRLVQRLLRHLKGNDWTPDFGFELSAPGASPQQTAEGPVHFLALPAGEPLSKHPPLVASLRLADGMLLSIANPLALRQHRGTIESTRSSGAAMVRLSRLEPVARQSDNLLLQEGMWRSMEVVLQPGPADALARAIDVPIDTRADWRLFDAVYRTGPPLHVEHPQLSALVEKYTAALARLPLVGDDFGSLGGLERYNHCAYIWEDWFRTGDPRLRRVALDYSENYHDFSVNWDPKPEHYGGGRYPPDGRTQPWPGSFRTRHNDAVTFCTKGFYGFWLAYEETGDPRFRIAAEAQARWSSRQVHATVNYTRCIGQVTDFVRLYEYTGDRWYLGQAERLWAEFQACQNPDLLFNEAGVPSTGNDLYVPDDSFGYRHPYVKSYIVQYAINALPDLLVHRPADKRLRDTVLACSDWMAKVQTVGGGWSYPGPTTAGLQWNIEYCHALMADYAVAPKAAYLDAAGRDLRAIVVLFGAKGEIASGVVPWETLAGKTAADLGRMYRRGIDRDRSRDFSDGRVTYGAAPDHLVYFQVLLRDYLRHRPESSLFAPDETLERILRMAGAKPPGK